MQLEELARAGIGVVVGGHRAQSDGTAEFFGQAFLVDRQARGRRDLKLQRSLAQRVDGEDAGQDEEQGKQEQKKAFEQHGRWHTRAMRRRMQMSRNAPWR